MSHTTACRTALIVPLALAVALLFVVSVANARQTPTAWGTNHAGTADQNTQLPSFFVIFNSVQSNVLPGDEVEFVATIHNWTGAATDNLEVAVAVTQYPEALRYVEDSTLARFVDEGSEVRLDPLSAQPTRLLATMHPDQEVRIEWDMAVSQCASRDRLIEVSFQVWTDDYGQNASPLITTALIYLAPHEIALANGLVSDYVVSPVAPAPGDAVQHTVRLTNSGRVHLAVRLREIPKHATLCIIQERGRPCESSYTLAERPPTPARSRYEPRWRIESDPAGTVTLEHARLSSGNILVVSWIGDVPADTPIGSEVTSHVDVSSMRTFFDRNQSETWTKLTTSITVVAPRRGLDLRVRHENADRSEPTYQPGEHASLVVSVQNRSTTPVLSPELGLDLPAAVRYISSSGSYSTPDYVAGNARRLPDTWLDDGATLPTIGPGESIDVRFNVAIPTATRNDNETVDIIAVLRSDEQNLRESLPLVIKSQAELRMIVEHPTDVGAGDDIEYRVNVTNMGHTDLEDVKFGIEGSCYAAYNPHSLWRVFNDGAYAIRSGDGSGPDSSIKGTDVTTSLLTLAAGETRDIVFTMHIAETTGGGTVEGPTILAFTADGPVVGQRLETEIEVVESVAEAVAEAVDSISPLGQGLGWFSEWAVSGVLASFVAGLVLPFSLWRLFGLWRERRRRRVTSPDLPPTPPTWKRPILWATGRCIAGAALLAAARDDIRDWIGGLWRR